MSVSRRGWLQRSSTATLLASFGGLYGCQASAENLQPVADQTTGLPLLKLPPGFTYQSFGWSGDPLSPHAPTPDRHDGMAAFAGTRGEVVLLRNHERLTAPHFGGAGIPTYDDFSLAETEGSPEFPGFGGGVTLVRYKDGRYQGAQAALAGTAVNCAGGPTPWGSWLTCEEFILRGSRIGGKDHGYVFEVPVQGLASARPIKDMGLFRHEAAAVDPATGIVYLTEDNGMTSGFYRYLPRNTQARVGALEEGGTLQMLKVRGVMGADLGAVPMSEVFDVEWVDIDDPDADPERFGAVGGGPPIAGGGKSGPYLQGEAKGGARFFRGEGCWYHDGLIYFADTAGSPSKAGAIWCLDPTAQRLLAFYASPDAAVADAIDNITVSPSGVVFACEDNGGLAGEDGIIQQPTRLLAIRPGGAVRVVGENNLLIDAPITDRPDILPGDYRGSEWAGATFSPDGQTLFVNVQTPGVTFAIEGPWSSV